MESPTSRPLSSSRTSRRSSHGRNCRQDPCVRSLPASMVLDELVRIGPSELVFPESLEDDDNMMGELAQFLQATTTPRRTGLSHPTGGRHASAQYQVATEAWALDDTGKGPARAAGGLVRFLLDTQSADGSALSHLQPPVLVQDDSVMRIDAATMRSLEIERTVRGGTSEGSLLSILQRCRTPMGRRTLRHRLCYPCSRSTPSMPDSMPFPPCSRTRVFAAISWKPSIPYRMSPA